MNRDHAMQLKEVDTAELLDLQTFEAFKVCILNHAFDYWLADKCFEPTWKSGPAKTGPARPVPPPLSDIMI